ncbi:MAG: PPC domain-containing DNA-binding protein [Candidatus Limnocylindrales bacterium]
MQFQRLGDRYQLRFESGEQVAEKLAKWLKANNIGYATMTGLGAVKSATVSYWNSGKQTYEQHTLDEQLEVVSLIGNVAIKDGVPSTHIHVGLGRSDLFVVGGPFNDATVHPNLEIALQPESDSVHRILDESCGVYVMDLPERP